MKQKSIYGLQQELFDIEAINTKPKLKQKSENNYVFDLMDALSAPVLTFSQKWADIIPKRILNILPLARMLALMKKEELATYEECVVYIYTRTFEAPMDHEWTNIYTHISCAVLKQWFNEDHWTDIGAPKELNEWLLSKLNHLRHHLYNKRREILKGRLKEQEQIPNKTIQKSEKEKPSQQQSFFS